MNKPYDSSKTRVCPAFTAIEREPKPFFKLLSQRLDIKVDDVSLEEIVYSVPGKRKEKALNPNPDYLRWLLHNPEKTNIPQRLKGHGRLKSSDECRLKLLMEKENCAGGVPSKVEMLNEGLAGIEDCERRGRYGKQWFVLEGATKPDVFIRTNKFYLIIEGKRTEGEPKTDTKWKQNRHQIVRHLEGLKYYAMHATPVLPAYGIFIVRGRDTKKFNIYNEIYPFIESLPHDEKSAEKIKDMYKGFMTWGDLYSAYAGKIRYIDHIEPNGDMIPCVDYDLMD